jgi:amidohydrolase
VLNRVPLKVELTDVDSHVDALEDELIAFRRDIHTNPELSNKEHRTTEKIKDALVAAGLEPRPLSCGTGLVCDIGTGEPVVGLRGDIDAIAVDEANQSEYRSTVPGVSHACGHDAHTALVLGSALALARVAGELPGAVRCVFQPAEEAVPGGALEVIGDGCMRGIRRILAFHCDPSLDFGKVGVRTGALTAAADVVEIELFSKGGHTARTYLTADLVYTAGRIVTELPAALSRLVDPRAGMSVVFGELRAGSAPNALPQRAHISGVMRVLDHALWSEAPELIEDLVRSIVKQMHGEYKLNYQRGCPPVVNDDAATACISRAARQVVGSDRVVTTKQSLGGEDFAWYLEHTKGAMARLGVRRAAAAQTDLHSPTFDIDERAIAVGAKVLTRAAIATLRD